MSRFFVEYLEDSPSLGLVTRDQFGTVTDHFSQGPATSDNQGFRRKRDAIAYCERLNKTAGRSVVILYGGGK